MERSEYLKIREGARAAWLEWRQVGPGGGNFAALDAALGAFFAILKTPEQLEAGNEERKREREAADKEREDRILEFLHSSTAPVFGPDIIAHLGLSSSIVYRLLHNLVEAGAVVPGELVQRKRGNPKARQWSLPETER